MFMPGHRLVGGFDTFDNSKVTCPLNPGSMNPDARMSVRYQRSWAACSVVLLPLVPPWPKQAETVNPPTRCSPRSGGQSLGCSALSRLQPRR